MNDLSEDRLLWRDLCLFHFTDAQLASLLRDGQDPAAFSTEEWKVLYNRLIK